MEDYCRDQNIFFNENERIQHSIKACEGLYKEFRGTLQRGFKTFKIFEDHPEWPLLMANESEIDVLRDADGSLRIVKKTTSAARHGDLVSRRSDRDLLGATRSKLGSRGTLSVIP